MISIFRYKYDPFLHTTEYVYNRFKSYYFWKIKDSNEKILQSMLKKDQRKYFDNC